MNSIEGVGEAASGSRRNRPRINGMEQQRPARAVRPSAEGRQWWGRTHHRRCHDGPRL